MEKNTMSQGKRINHFQAISYSKIKSRFNGKKKKKHTHNVRTLSSRGRADSPSPLSPPYTGRAVRV